MQPEALANALNAIFPMIRSRLQEAHSIAAAAESCAASGNPEGAFRILLDIEQRTHEAAILLNAASVFRRDEQE